MEKDDKKNGSYVAGKNEERLNVLNFWKLFPVQEPQLANGEK